MPALKATVPSGHHKKSSSLPPPQARPLLPYFFPGAELSPSAAKRRHHNPKQGGGEGARKGVDRISMPDRIHAGPAFAPGLTPSPRCIAHIVPRNTRDLTAWFSSAPPADSNRVPSPLGPQIANISRRGRRQGRHPWYGPPEREFSNKSLPVPHFNPTPAGILPHITNPLSGRVMNEPPSNIFGTNGGSARRSPSPGRFPPNPLDKPHSHHNRKPWKTAKSRARPLSPSHRKPCRRSPGTYKCAH